MGDAVTLYWQPGCSSCLRTKEFLTKRGVPFTAVNVAADPAGWDALAGLGLRTVPVVTRGESYVFGQVLAEVADFLGLPPVGGPQLAPAALAARLDSVLATAARLARQVPEASRDVEWPGRARSIHALAYHIFHIPELFLAAAAGERLDDAALNAPPPPALADMAGVAAFGETMRGRVRDWWAGEVGGDARRPLDTYFGPQSLHVVLERTVWHSAQHTRQLATMLERLGIAPDRPLTDGDLAGLPLPESVSDS